MSIDTPATKPLNPAFYLLFLTIASLAVLGCAPLVGLKSIGWKSLLNPLGQNPEEILLWKIRIPRVFTGFLAGAVLSVSGAIFQALFRNPLATPFTLGVSSAASLGAIIYLRLGLTFSFPLISGICAFSFLGALICIGLVYALAGMKGGFSTARLLLAGVATSFFVSSLIMFVHYTSDANDMFRLMRRLMGSLSGGDFEALMGLLPFAAGGFLLFTPLSWELNLIALGEEIALSRGVPLGAIRHLLFLSTCLMEGAVVAFCGPIGFVGLMVPHMARLMVGTRHQWLLPASFLLGGIFLALCDTFARLIIAPAEMPVGIITSLLGGPFFLWLLLRTPENQR